MDKILLFGGTTEGRLLWEYCRDMKIPAAAAVATEYGETLLPASELSQVLVGRMDRSGMEVLMQEGKYSLVIDATHPYAREVTENIRSACKSCNMPYIRVLRESYITSGVIAVDSVKDAADYLNTHTGNALITTGSKELKAFTKVKDYTRRLTVRVLPDPENVGLCQEYGFTGRSLICMQGPFSEEFNLALLKEIKADYLVTKESGSYGGFMEKVQAAKRAGVQVIVIKRPETENGYSLEQVKDILLKPGFIPDGRLG